MIARLCRQDNRQFSLERNAPNSNIALLHIYSPFLSTPALNLLLPAVYYSSPSYSPPSSSCPFSSLFSSSPPHSLLTHTLTTTPATVSPLHPTKPSPSSKS